jgi:hypothetical protein
VDRIAQSVDQARQAGEQVRMGHLAYGLLCQVIPLLIDPLQQAAIVAARESAESLRSAASELRSTARRYEQEEENAGNLFHGFMP